MDVIRKSWKYFKKYWYSFVLVLFFMLLQLALGILMPQIPQLIIDRVLNPALGAAPVYSSSNVFSFLLVGYAENDYWGMLTVMLLLMGSNRLLFYLIHYIRWNIHHNTMMRGQDGMRTASFNKMLRSSPLQLNHYTSGNLLNITNNDPAAVKEMYLIYGMAILENALNVIVATFFLARIHPLLMIVPMVSGTITAVIIVFYNRTIKVKYDKIRDGNIALSSFLQENINGVRIIRSFASEEKETEMFEKRNAAFKENYVSLARTASKYSAIFRTIGEAMGLCSIIVGVVLALRGLLSVGEFATFTAYTSTVNSCIIGMASHFGNLQNSLTAGRRYFDFMDSPEPVSEPALPVAISAEPRFRFENVSMTFEGKPVLQDVSFDLPFGKKMGIMGETGSGKSVALKLLNRLYDCTDGRVTVDGNNIRAVSVDALRHKISYVMQDVFLFSDTVTNNIAFYDEENATQERIERASRISESVQIIPKLSDGYETIVGERGLGLSGGQKQRISIARALFKDAPVILLDDCSSALDYETQGAINENFLRELSDRTVVTVSHRASAVMHCDEILFFDCGVVAERGTHDELMRLNGKYAGIYREQEAARLEEVS